MSSHDLVTDPVCGMLIAPSQAAGVRTHQDAVYHLCSPGCVAKFEADAEAYIAASRVAEFRTWQATVLTHVNSPPSPHPDPH